MVRTRSSPIGSAHVIVHRGFGFFRKKMGFHVLLIFILLFRNIISYKQCICSAQSRNGYNSGIVPAQSRNSHFAGRSKNSYLARFNSGIVPAQSRNRDKVRIYYFPAQSRNRGQSKNIHVCVIIISIIILFCEYYD